MLCKCFIFYVSVSYVVSVMILKFKLRFCIDVNYEGSVVDLFNNTK